MALQSMTNRQQIITDPESFRAWLRLALPAVGIRPSRLGADLGLGKNTLRDFLETPGRDIKLGTAHQVSTRLQAEAAARGVVLPEIEGAA